MQPDCETVMYAQKVPTHREAMTSRVIQSLTIPEPKPDEKKVASGGKTKEETTEVKEGEKIKQVCEVCARRSLNLIEFGIRTCNPQTRSVPSWPKFVEKVNNDSLL